MKNNTRHTPASLMGIHRHRLTSDGRGITTLVGFHGCPLQCRYCLNDSCHSSAGIWKSMTAQELYQEVVCDEIYFLATGGGITFGGGEPALHSDYIGDFRHLCGREWSITIETSLNTPRCHIEQLIETVDHFIIDIKTLDEKIYQAYTGLPIEPTITNLQYLTQKVDCERITVRVPLIPQYNTLNDVANTTQQLKAMGITHIDTFTYRTDMSHKGRVDGKSGKAVCNVLKRVRQVIADANEITYAPHPCPHDTCTSGNCPRCEQELTWLTAQLDHMRQNGKNINL